MDDFNMDDLIREASDIANGRVEQTRKKPKTNSITPDDFSNSESVSSKLNDMLSNVVGDFLHNATEEDKHFLSIMFRFFKTVVAYNNETLRDMETDEDIQRMLTTLFAYMKLEGFNAYFTDPD